jgi:hypothetical protein
MFEVIICTVTTGRVQRKQFATLAEAEACVACWEAKKARYRAELRRLEAPATEAARPARVEPLAA